MRIEVAYALPESAITRVYELPAGATVGEALRAAMGDPAFAHLDLEELPVGVFGAVARRDQVLNPDDRVELYRPLALDPKAARRVRARQARGLKDAKPLRAR
jgi:putative ubiquitin-RnfH superfamily antitoxin RatB of RatAB toxin-antitoxin module